MTKPRLLISLTIQFCVRYLLRTGLLHRLTEYAQPVVLLAWQDEQLRQELELAGAEVHALPEAHFGLRHERLRTQINIWHLGRLASPSTVIDHRRADLDRPFGTRLRRTARDVYYKLKLALPGMLDRLLSAEKEALATDTNLQEFQSLLRQLRPDALFSLTPFLRSEELLLRAAKVAGLPLCTAILSFDNITTRGWIPIIFDHYLLWNRYNVTELQRAYPEAVGKPIDIVGSPQFDFYWDPTYLWLEQEWRTRLGLPESCPVILFGGGVRQIVPQEPLFLEQIDQAIETGHIPENPIVLFRPHPNDSLQRWASVLQRAKHVVCDLPWATGAEIGKTNITRIDIERLSSTLHHCQVHVNTSSTLTIDGAIFDRPQVGPAYDNGPERRYERITKELYLREHYLPITHSGGLHLTYSQNELVEALCAGLQSPGLLTAGRKLMVQEVCTYNDGQSTKRVEQALRNFLHETAPQSIQLPTL